MKYSFRSIISALVVAVLFTGCCCLGKMTNADAISYTVTPTPLEMHCDEVAVEIKADIPAQYFDRKATLEVTPKLVGETGTVARFKPFYLQGEKVAANNPVIVRKEGGSYTYNDKIAYQDGLDYSDLELDIIIKRGSKTKTLDPYKIGVGTIVTPRLVQNDDRVLIGKDKFQRITQHKQEATINYTQNSAYVRPAQLREDDIKELTAFVAEAASNEAITIKNVVVEAYASPEGELRLNEKLADNRAESARKVVANILRRKKLDSKEDGFYQAIPKGEDWLGFKTEMESSSIKDKELILRILTMYDDLAKREEEIRNLSKTYTEVADQILPGLRRSQIDVNYEVIGRTDQEILALAKENSADLSVEEMLYAATLTSNSNEKLQFYGNAQKQYPNDYRGFNNAGVVEFKSGNTEKAKALFNQAKAINATAEVHNNLGVIARWEGKKAEAREHYQAALSAGSDVNYNIGILDIQECKYNAATTNFGENKTYNHALAAYLDGNNEKALEALKSSGNTDANTHYLYAIVYANQKDEASMASHLKSAIAADASLKAKAAKDREFYAYKDNAGFKAIVQ